MTGIDPATDGSAEPSSGNGTGLEYRPLPSHRTQVESMAGFGVPEVDIAMVIGVAPETLRAHYGSELDQGHIKANTRVAENLYRKATGEGREAVTAAIFWLKTRAGWKETSAHEITGKDKQPINVVISAEDAKLC